MFFRSVLWLAVASSLWAQNPATPAGQAAPKQPPIRITPGPPQAASPAVPADRVVVAVGDVKITAAQFNEIIDSLPENIRAAARGPQRKDFGENLVRVLVLAEEGRTRKLDQAPEYKAQMLFQSSNLLAGKAFTQMAEGIKVDDAAVRAYYDAHKSDYEQVRARHILIRSAGSPAPADSGKKELTDEEALAKAKELRKKLADGADFAALASAESDDTGSKVNGGDLNFFKHGQMVGPFEQAAFSMNVGDISEPVKTQFGYHIIKVEAKKGFDDVRAEVERRYRGEEAQKALAEMEKKASPTLDPEFFGLAAK